MQTGAVKTKRQCSLERVNTSTNKDLGYFLKLAEDVGTRAEFAEGTANNLQAAADAGIGDGNVPEIFDCFAKL